MAQVILAIDQGTTGSTVMLIDRQLNVLARGYQEFRQIYPRPGWVEHDPKDIWRSVTGATNMAFIRGKVNPRDVAAIGITNQRETSIAWDAETGEALHNAIVWQCRRTSPVTERLKAEGLEEVFRQKTGLVLDPYFSGTKYAWLLDNVPGLRGRAREGKVRLGTVDSFLVHRLTKGKVHATDASNASRTLLMRLSDCQWDGDLCRILNVPVQCLPRILDCTETFGHTKAFGGVPDGIPVCGIAGDQQAALFGQACFSPGEAKCTYGTGAFMLMNTGAVPEPSKNGLLTTVAWKVQGKTTYALEGSAFIAGAVVQWLRDGMKFFSTASEIESLAAEAPDSGGVVLVPAFVGLGAPHWRSSARGLITGITRGTSRAHLARAALEGMALQNVDVLRAMEEDSGTPIPRLKVDGGASANNLLMRMQADFLGREIVRPKMVETTALGAACLAGLGAGVFTDTADIAAAWREDRVFTPKMDEAARRESIARWNAAVAKA
jgi:glycerol kinase